MELTNKVGLMLFDILISNSFDDKVIFNVVMGSIEYHLELTKPPSISASLPLTLIRCLCHPVAKQRRIVPPKMEMIVPPTQ